MPMTIDELCKERAALIEEIRLLKQHRADETRNLRQVTEACKAMHERLQRMESGRLGR